MNILQLFLFCSTWNWVRAYIYPLCSDLGNGDCYKSLPIELFTFDTLEEPIKQEPPLSHYLPEAVAEYLGPFLEYYIHFIEPYVTKITFFPPLKEEVRKKEKWYHQMYMPMVIVGLITYLVWTLTIYHQFHSKINKSNNVVTFLDNLHLYNKKAVSVLSAPTQEFLHQSL